MSIFNAQFFDSDTFTLIILPCLIFISRICDVSIGTIRIIFVSRGNKLLAPLLGFFEVLIWLVAIGRIMQNITNVTAYLAYAGGFAAGNFIGISIEKKLAVGIVLIRIITKKDASELIDVLKYQGYGITNVFAEGNLGKVNVIFTVVKRFVIPDLLKLIKQYNPNAFISIEELSFATEEIFPHQKSFYRRFGTGEFPKLYRKGK